MWTILRSRARLPIAVIVTLALAAVMVAVVVASVTINPHGPFKTTHCPRINGPLHTEGAQILNQTGERYIPYGINLVELAHPLYPRTIQRAKARIDAATDTWCSNTVRIMVSQDEVIDGKGHDASELRINVEFRNALETLVAYARKQGLVVVLNLQTQSDRDFETEFMPTSRSAKFWNAMAAMYKKEPGVVFDLFNEPGKARTWSNWRNGFTRGGVEYIGFQQLAESIRDAGAANLIWVEGVQHGVQLAQVWQHRLTGVDPLAYAAHRPPRPNTEASWSKNFGYLAERNLAPVVVGEWSQYARSGAPWACWEDAPTAVPRWLNYLASIRVGMIVTKLAKGHLLESDDLSDPARLKSNWRCETGLNQGAGNQIMTWFHRRNTVNGLKPAATPTG